jgi:hypothetical protein
MLSDTTVEDRTTAAPAMAQDAAGDEPPDSVGVTLSSPQLVTADTSAPSTLPSVTTQFADAGEDIESAHASYGTLYTHTGTGARLNECAPEQRSGMSNWLYLKNAQPKFIDSVWSAIRGLRKPFTLEQIRACDVQPHLAAGVCTALSRPGCFMRDGELLS